MVVRASYPSTWVEEVGGPECKASQQCSKLEGSSWATVRLFQPTFAALPQCRLLCSVEIGLFSYFPLGEYSASVLSTCDNWYQCNHGSKHIDICNFTDNQPNLKQNRSPRYSNLGSWRSLHSGWFWPHCGKTLSWEVCCLKETVYTLPRPHRNPGSADHWWLWSQGTSAICHWNACGLVAHNRFAVLE